MDSHSLPMHSLTRILRASSLCLVTTAALLPHCATDDSGNTRRNNGSGATTSGAGGATGTTGTTGNSSGTKTGATGTPTSGGTTGTTTGSTTGTTTGGPGSGTGGAGTGAGGSSAGGAGPGGSAGGTGPGTGTPPDASGGSGGSRPPGTPPGAEKIIGIDFMQRIVGTWTGMNQSGPLGTAFPMTVDFSPSGPSFLFGKLNLDGQNNVSWGFNIETYAGKDVLAYRNGGYLAGAKRDSRLQLVEYDVAKGYYRFCAVKESGFPVDGCNYIDARYTFSAPDKMLFDVTTQSGKPHVHWEATRTQSHVLPDPFPASVVSQGQGEAPWPQDAGL